MESKTGLEISYCCERENSTSKIGLENWDCLKAYIL